MPGLSLTWDALSVRGIGGKEDVLYHPDLGTILTPWKGFRAKRRAAKAVARRSHAEAAIGPADAMSWTADMTKPGKHEPGLRPGQRYIVKDSFGLLRPGEMMLVVGRPGSGCSTMLRALAGLTQAYAGTDGSLRYGDMAASSKSFRPYRSLVCFNSEDDVHDPNLTVGRTMDFATRNELVAPAARQSGPDGAAVDDTTYRAEVKDQLLSTFGVSHTHDTKVGDQYVRGVSGGERRRLTLAEAMTTDASIYCWDNATRGLDANTALSYAQICREQCDKEGKVNVVSLYQAGNAIYDLFDKVTVIAEGQIIYYGPRQNARGYFEALGFEHLDGANTADFLTAVTALEERKVKADFDGPVANTAAEFAAAYKQSDMAAKMRQELEEYQADTTRLEKNTLAIKAKADAKKNKGVGKTSAQVTGFGAQLKAALVREYQQRWGDNWCVHLRSRSRPGHSGCGKSPHFCWAGSQALCST